MASKGEGEGRRMEFNPARALSLAQNCVLANGDVSLPVYIDGIEEMYKLFIRFEGQNPFILSGIEVKLSILRELCSGSDKEHYATVQKMLTYEQQHDLIERDDKPSGTQTLLRIHRLTELTRAGIEIINDPSIPDEALGEEVVKAYTATLGRFHPQLMVASIQWALPYVVPSRSALMAEIGLDTDHPAESTAWLVQMMESLRKLYDAIQKEYADRGLLSLSQGNL